MIIGKDDGDDFRRLQSAMDILNFSPEDQGSIFRVLSSILHLGNVFFHRVEVLQARTHKHIFKAVFTFGKKLAVLWLQIAAGK